MVKEYDKQTRNAFLAIAVPVTAQNLLQSSFGIADQIMTGQLGSVCIAGIGLGSKFSSIYSVLVNAIAATAGIMLSQYLGQKEEGKAGRSFYTNLLAAIVAASLFLAVSVFCPYRIMGMYTRDDAARLVAAKYLKILGFSYVPMAVHTLVSALLRCRDQAKLPLCSSMGAAILNTVLNYGLIFGKFGFPRLGAEGAALATVISQTAGCVLAMYFYWRESVKKGWKLPFSLCMESHLRRQYLGILGPMVVCEFFWILGENVYASIYGHMGTQETAAMTLTVPIQSLMMGAMGGISQAAGILVGKSLGSGNYERAYEDSKRLMICGLWGSVFCSAVLMGVSGWYVKIYQVEDEVQKITNQILWAFALAAPVKVQNMVLGGGILRSGGKTKYVMAVDLAGTWIFGVPLGAAAAFLMGLPIPAVYLMLSLEEAVRLGISLALFRKRVWMNQIG